MSFHLVKRSGIFYCRVWVPLDLRHWIKRRELKKSLGTGNKLEAKSRAAALSALAEQFYFRARVGMLTERELEILAVELIGNFTGKIEDHRKSRRTSLDFLREGVPHGFDCNFDLSTIDNTFTYVKQIEDVEKLSQTYDNRIKFLKEELATGNYSDFTRRLTKMLIIEKGLDVVLPPEDWFSENENEWFNAPPAEFSMVCETIIKALIDAYNVEKERLFRNKDTPLQEKIAKRIEAAKQKPRLLEFWNHYREDQIQLNRWRAGTIEKNDQHFARIVKIIGDRELSSYCEEDAQRLVKSLKTTVTRGKELSVSTINYSLTLCATLFKAAMKNPNKWGCTFNPFAGRELQDTRATNERKDLFGDEELAGLIRVLAKVRRNVHPARFWVPLLALYTGARANELCQLRTKDVKKHTYKDKNGKDSELFYINIEHDPKDLMSTKNQKNRTCPIHPELVNLGLLKYVVVPEKC